jgi:DNA-binding CsgD family transcriptional regulator
LRRRIHADLLATLVLAETERGQSAEAERALARLAGIDGRSRATAICLQIARALALSEPTAELALQAEEQAADIVVLGGCPRSWAAVAHDAAGDRARAQSVATEHLEFARRWSGPTVLGRALALRGVLDAGAGRIGFLDEAVAVLEDSPARLELARAEVERGAALRRAGRRRAAREALMRGGDLAHRCGADALAARARAELVATGARPRRAAFSGVGSLTAAESRVATLAAAGLTNREIARQLTVSAKTVSGQLSAVYLKLDVHDRSALAAAMQVVGEASVEIEQVP